MQRLVLFAFSLVVATGCATARTQEPAVPALESGDLADDPSYAPPEDFAFATVSAPEPETHGPAASAPQLSVARQNHAERPTAGAVHAADR